VGEIKVPFEEILKDKKASPSIAMFDSDCNLRQTASSFDLTAPKYRFKIVGSTWVDWGAGFEIVI
jgi:hypothetical protein